MSNKKQWLSVKAEWFSSFEELSSSEIITVLRLVDVYNQTGVVDLSEASKIVRVIWKVIVSDIDRMRDISEKRAVAGVNSQKAQKETKEKVLTALKVSAKKTFNKQAFVQAKSNKESVVQAKSNKQDLVQAKPLLLPKVIDNRLKSIDNRLEDNSIKSIDNNIKSIDNRLKSIDNRLEDNNIKSIDNSIKGIDNTVTKVLPTVSEDGTKWRNTGSYLSQEESKYLDKIKQQILNQ